MGNCMGISRLSVPTTDAHVEIERAGVNVTVKKIKCDHIPGISKWQLKMADMKYLGKFYNPNMAYVVGKMDEQFIPNGNLRQHLDGDYGTVLSWATRMKIAVGIGEEIKYLNEQFAPIDWKDLTSEDVLLGQDYHPKLSNLGKLASTLPPPHYPGCSSSYGICMLLLELLTGKKTMDLTRPVEQSGLIDWIRHRTASVDHGDLDKVELTLTVLVADPRLQGNYDMDSAINMLVWGMNGTAMHVPNFSRAGMMDVLLPYILEDSPLMSSVTMEHYITLTHSLSAMRIK